MLETIDQNILLLINGCHSPYFDDVMSMVSGKWIWIPMYFCILVELVRRLKCSWQLLAVLLTIGLTFFLTDFCCSQILRPLFPRLRPVSVENPIHELVNAVQGYRHNSYGFPSCHASNTFGLATLMWLFFRSKQTTFLMFFWAIATCYSRVYLGVHYPGDTFVGALIGLACGYMTHTLCLNLLRWREIRMDLPEKKRMDLPEKKRMDLSVKTPWLIPISNVSIFLIILITSIFV